MELAACENALFALEPMSRTVPTTRTRITANMTAYSAISCPDSSDQSLKMILDIPSSYPQLVTYDAQSRRSCQIVLTSIVRGGQPRGDSDTTPIAEPDLEMTPLATMFPEIHSKVNQRRRCSVSPVCPMGVIDFISTVCV